MIILRENDKYKIYKNNNREIIENKSTGEKYFTIVFDDDVRINTIWKVSKSLDGISNIWFRRTIDGEYIVCCRGTYRIYKNNQQVEIKKWDDAIKFGKKIATMKINGKPNKFGYYLK